MGDRVSTIRTGSEEETIEAGRRLAPKLRGVVLLNGPLGAGKTTLVRGIVSGIPGAQAEEVSSPTFTLIHDYGAGVFHIDLYRLEEEREIASLGLEDLFDEAKLVLIEWGERLGARIPQERVDIRIEADGEDGRVIHIHERGGTRASGTETT